MTNKDDVSQDLKPNKMRKNNKHLRNILRLPNKTWNHSFSDGIDQGSLFNIGLAKLSPPQTVNILFNIMKSGCGSCDKFIGECRELLKPFDDKITKNKILTFVSERKRYKFRSDNNIASVKMIRDFFGSILFFPLQRNFDIEELMSYPLTPISLFLCYVDGL